MNHEEFRIALDTSLSKDRVNLCLEYINDLESRTCENCEYNDEEWRGCELLQGTPPDGFGCNQFERKTDE